MYIDETTRQRLEILVAVIIIILLGLLIWWLLQEEETTIIDTGTDVEVVDGEYYTPEQLAPLSEEELEQAQQAPEAAIRTFVERIGSFSSEADYQNMEDVLPMTTDSLRASLEQAIASGQDLYDDGSYAGVNTTVITMEVTEQEDGSVSATVVTQREAATGTPDNAETFFQDISVTVVPNGTRWLIDGYIWDELQYYR